ncbi:MAG: beta-ketoacyl-[acyl-carrier-protein] synthase family protein [Polyangiaceae bacterium]
MRAAVITGLGAVSALGVGVDETYRALERGESGIREGLPFDTSEMGSSFGALVPGELSNAADRALAFGVTAGREALAHAGIGAEFPRDRVALVVGTSLGSGRGGLTKVARGIAAALVIEGAVVVVSTACSSSTHAVGLARDLLRAGVADVVLAGGTDELVAELVAGFASLGVVSVAPCAPFSEPFGTTIGEGAGFAVVESLEHFEVRRPGVSPIAHVGGYAISADAHHATSPDPTGAGVRRAIVGALADAALEPAAIDYVNVHGTGTAANDPAEYRAVEATLGAAGKLPWISASKSFLGHAQGAAGILELIVTLEAMRRGKLPPTMNFRGARPRCPSDPIAGSTPREAPAKTALKLSSAFGGANAALVVETAPRPRVDRARARVAVAGASVFGPQGMSLAALADARRWPVGLAPAIAIEKVVRGVDPRGVDRAMRLCSRGSRRFASAGMLGREVKRERVGLFVAQTRVAREAAREFDRSIAERGVARLSASAFSRMVLNASAGAVTRMLGLKGPMTAITTDASSGVVVAALAAAYLERREDVDAIVVVGLHEGEQPEALDGAAAIVLARAGLVAGLVEVDAWRVAGPRENVGSIAGEDSIEGSAVDEDEGGLVGVAACASAYDIVSGGRSRRVRVVAGGGLASAALTLSRGADAPAEVRT